MSRRKKHKKQSEVRTLNNVFHNKIEDIKGKIREYFSNPNPIVLELGCGNGEYTNSLALKYPDKNFVGVDRAGARIWTASKRSIELELKNVIYLLEYVERIHEYFDENSVEEIWIPFPNPLPRRKQMKKMLVHPRYLEIYKRLMIPEGSVHLKTDDDILYEYTVQLVEKENLKLIAFSDDLYSDGAIVAKENTLTKFESNYINAGKKIKYVNFGFNY